MKTFLTGISILWILIIVIGNVPRIAGFNLSSNDGLGGVMGSLVAIGLLTSPAIWYLVKKEIKKAKSAFDPANEIVK